MEVSNNGIIFNYNQNISFHDLFTVHEQDELFAFKENIPDRPVGTASVESGWLGALNKVTKAAFGTSWTNSSDWSAMMEDLNQMFNEATFTTKTSITPLSNEPGPSNNVFGNASNALKERGEKLGKLEAKFGKISNDTNEFLDTIREYNRKQQEKKWYQI